MAPARLKRLQRLFGALQRVSPALAARVALDRFLKPTRRPLEQVDRPLLARATLQTLASTRGRLQVYSWGSGERTVLIVHGWGSHAPRYSAFIEAIVARGWRALAFDAPGHGESPGRRSSLQDFRDSLEAVITAHGPVHAVIAHSLGAAATASLLAGSPPATLKAAALLSMPRDIGYLLDSYLLLLQVNDDVMQRVHARFRTRFGQTPESLSTLQMAPRIGQRILLVHDRDDDVVPLEQAEEIAARLRHVALHITEGLGHSALLRDPATVGAVVGFLTAHDC